MTIHNMKNTQTYIPVATAIPALATFEAVETPSNWKNHIPSDIWGVIQHTNQFTVRQHMKLLPKHCCGCPPCLKQENTYSVYAGLTQENQSEFLRVDEVSNDWNRCCCTPYHPLKLEVRQHIPTDFGGTDSDNVMKDVSNNFARFNMRKKVNEQRMKDREKSMTYPVLMTMQRTDGQRCIACPCKWLSTFVCFNCCQDGMHLYAGALENEQGEDLGRPTNNSSHMQRDEELKIGSAIQPNFGGICTPTIHLSTKSEPQEYGKIEGPCCFGGWSEMCCDFSFAVSKFTSPSKQGDLGVIIKKKPASFAGMVRELVSDADVYSIEFKDTQLDASKKATVLMGLLLADYMFFDGNTEKCSQDDNAVYCYCCYFSCFGKICPVYVAIPKNGGN